MKTENKLGVALVKEMCPVCMKESEAIVMNRTLSKESKEEVEKMHGIVVGFSQDLCEECETARTKDGADGVYLIGVDMEKTTDRDNPYRSGKILCVKRDALEGVTKNAVYIDTNLLG